MISDAALSILVYPLGILGCFVGALVLRWLLGCLADAAQWLEARRDWRKNRELIRRAGGRWSVVDDDGQTWFLPGNGQTRMVKVGEKVYEDYHFPEGDSHA